MNDAWIERICRVVDHIQSHLDEDLEPAELAARAGFSLHHFHRVFRGITDESVMGFIRRLRLERAAQRLTHGQASVTDVALSSGYGSHEAFTRAFQVRFGRAPSQYREENTRQLKELPCVVRQEPERWVIAHRHVGSYEGCYDAWQRLEQWATLRNIARDADKSGFGLCYDDPEVTEVKHLRYDACLLLDQSSQLSGELPAGFVERKIPAGLYAVAPHRGSYSGIEETYLTLIGRWLPQRGVELYGEPVIEKYLQGWPHVLPDDYLTEVMVRIREE